eukprot:1177347-Alexandrium_andersonii.AAC.1
MSASLVGSEMCIRDRGPGNPRGSCTRTDRGSGVARWANPSTTAGGPRSCLLYTSDAADDM